MPEESFEPELRDHGLSERQVKRALNARRVSLPAVALLWAGGSYGLYSVILGSLGIDDPTPLAIVVSLGPCAALVGWLLLRAEPLIDSVVGWLIGVDVRAVEKYLRARSAYEAALVTHADAVPRRRRRRLDPMRAWLAAALLVWLAQCSVFDQRGRLRPLSGSSRFSFVDLASCGAGRALCFRHGCYGAAQAQAHDDLHAHDAPGPWEP